MMWPTIEPLIGYGVLAGCAVGFVGGAVLYFWPEKITEVVPVTGEKKSIFDQSVNVTGENSGTIAPTYNNTVNVGIKPEFRPVGEPRFIERADGGLITVLTAQMTAPASRLTVQAQGNNLVSLYIARPAQGGVSSTSKMEVRRWSGDNHLTESFANPSGTYEITIQTRDHNRPKIAHEVEL